jgi:hypothetical protein
MRRAKQRPPRQEDVMRLIVSFGLAVALIPAVGADAADTSPNGQYDWVSDVSAAKKKRIAKRQPAEKVQYLRAVPTTPPPGAKQ